MRTLAGGPRVGKLQRELPGVEYLLWVAYKVDNQQMHKSLLLNFAKALQVARQYFVHCLFFGLIHAHSMSQTFSGLLGLSTHLLLS